VAYVGHFSSSLVDRSWDHANATGKLALVVVRQSDNAVVGSVVLPRPPIRLNHVDVFQR